VVEVDSDDVSLGDMDDAGSEAGSDAALAGSDRQREQRDCCRTHVRTVTKVTEPRGDCLNRPSAGARCYFLRFVKVS